MSSCHPARSIAARSAVCLGLLTAACPAASSTTRPDAPAPQRPNLVFILADDLGWADTGCYGSRFHRTPHIDALARRGMKFTNAYAANPLCSPTRASILTGLYPARLGITAPTCHLPEVRLKASLPAKAAPSARWLIPTSATRLDTTHRTLPEFLRDAGYATAHFGKWHLGATPFSPLEQGFASDFPHHHGPGPAGSYLAPWKFSGPQPVTGQQGEHIEDRTAQEAAQFIRQHRQQPFFLNYWAFSVHSPYEAKPDSIAQFASTSPSGPQSNPLYAAMVASLDDAVGTIVRTLESENLLDRTIIVFFSDNGGVNWQAMKSESPAGKPNRFAHLPPTSNAPLRGGKASVFEGGVREPCLVVWPGVTPQGSQSDALIQSIDFLPTLAEATGITLPADLQTDGRSFAPVLRNPATPHRDTIFTFFPHDTLASGQHPACAVRRGPWKLIRYFHGNPDGSHRLELYNLASDPSESTSVAASEPALTSELDTLISQFLKDTHAVVPQPNPAWNPKAAAHRPDSSPKKQNDPSFSGWKVRNASATIRDGALVVTNPAKDPFLGFAPGPLKGPAHLHFRLRNEGGPGRVAWLPSPNAQPAASPKPINFSTKAGDWTTLRLTIPHKENSAGIVRLHLPLSDTTEIDFLEIITGDTTRRSDFTNP